MRARGGGEQTGPSPVDRRKKGSKHVAVVDGYGIPLAATVSAANAPDVTQLEGVVDAIPDVKGKPGRPRRRPDELYGDRGFDSEPHRAKRRRRGDQAEAGAAEDRARQRAGESAMGGGAVLQLAAPVRAAAGANR